MPRKIYRQGDVLLEQIDWIDSEYLKKYGDFISDRLEISSENGYSHRIDAEIYRYGSSTYIVVEKPTALKHHQHPEILVEPGIYQLRFIRDWLLRESRPFD